MAIRQFSETDHTKIWELLNELGASIMDEVSSGAVSDTGGAVAGPRGGWEVDSVSCAYRHSSGMVSVTLVVRPTSAIPNSTNFINVAFVRPPYTLTTAYPGAVYMTQGHGGGMPRSLLELVPPTPGEANSLVGGRFPEGVVAGTNLRFYACYPG